MLEVEVLPAPPIAPLIIPIKLESRLVRFQEKPDLLELPVRNLYRPIQT